MKLHNRVNGRELKAILQQSDEKRTTLSFYKYFHFANPELVRNHLFLTWDKIGVKVEYTSRTKASMDRYPYRMPEWRTLTPHAANWNS